MIDFMESAHHDDEIKSEILNLTTVRVRVNDYISQHHYYQERSSFIHLFFYPSSRITSEGICVYSPVRFSPCAVAEGFNHRILCQYQIQT